MTRWTLVIIIGVAAVVAVGGDVLRDAKVAFPGFYAVFGFGGAVAVIVVSRWVVAPLLRRPDATHGSATPGPSGAGDE